MNASQPRQKGDVVCGGLTVLTCCLAAFKSAMLDCMLEHIETKLVLGVKKTVWKTLFSDGKHPSRMASLAKQQECTANVVLGGQIFGPDSEDIHVVGSGVSDTDVVVLGAKLVAGEFWSVKAVDLVSCQACRAAAMLKFLCAVTV